MVTAPHMLPSTSLSQHQTAVCRYFLFFPFQFWLFADFLNGRIYPSTGGAGSWFNLFWPVSDAVMTNPMAGVSTLSSWRGRVQLSTELEDFMGRSFKVPKGDLRTINDFIVVDACVKCPYLTELCCYRKYVSMKRYALKDAQSIMGSALN